MKNRMNSHTTFFLSFFFYSTFVCYLSKWLEVNQSGRLGIKEFNKRYCESTSVSVIGTQTAIAAQADGGGAVAAQGDGGREAPAQGGFTKQRQSSPRFAHSPTVDLSFPVGADADFSLLHFMDKSEQEKNASCSDWWW